jgi:hypothetical protein
MICERAMKTGLTFTRRAIALLAGFFASAAFADPIVIAVHPDQVIQPANKCLKGICIEDVNHEIYGGLYSQMIYGESFQEPAIGSGIQAFRTYGGDWKVEDQIVRVAGEDGPKLVSDHAPLGDGSASVEIKFTDTIGENAGLIVRVSRPGIGADAFAGYEISLDPTRQIVRLGRHSQNYQLLRESRCDVPVNQWIALQVTLEGPNVRINVDSKLMMEYNDARQSLEPGMVGLRVWHCKAHFRNLRVQPAGAAAELIPFAQSKSVGQVSGMWQSVVCGSATGTYSLKNDRPFIGTQSQQIRFESGEGEVGIANSGLNHWGINFVRGRPYEGYVWAKADKQQLLLAELKSGDGAKTYARQPLNISAGDWQRISLSLRPSDDDRAGRFVLSLKQPGEVSVGHAFLQPGDWGRFKGLPARKDVVQGIIDQGVTVMRYGGSMVNSPNYRWKSMIGSRDRRPPYRGTWNPYSSNGWGVIDFLNLCEAANIVGVPDLNVNEGPQDMADFIDYVNGPAATAWGQKRVADGHPASYHLRYLEIGNEERVDSAYAAKFAAIAMAVWAKDPDIILIVGDFSYRNKITDPDRISGADSGISNMDGQRQILELAGRNHREVWFDIHIWAEQLQPSDNLVAAPSYMDALDRIADGAKHRIVTFELNANSHGLMRGLANAMTINTLTRDNRMPIITSANGLQPDGQNDNGWDQGLLFLDPSRVWLQAPGYVTQMQARIAEPLLVKCDVDAGSHLDVTATRSADGKTLVLQIVNLDEAQSAILELTSFVPAKTAAHVTELSGPLDARNTADNPKNIVPMEADWPVHLDGGKVQRDFPAHSFTIIRFE